MSYAVISLGGKQYRVREGERLLVDRVSQAAGKTFHPDILFVGGDGRTELAPKGVTVTARVVDHVLGDKVRIGKYRPKTGYRRHAGHRSHLSRIEIEKIGRKETRKAASKSEDTDAPKTAARRPRAGEKKQDETAASAKRRANKETE